MNAASSDPARVGTTGPSPIIVSALFAPADQARFDGLRRAHFPPERNHLAAHLTMFHHLPASAEGELRRRLREATHGVSAPCAEAAGLVSLGRGVAVRIVSPELAAIREDLAEAFAPLLTPQDSAGWRAHVTIQNKVAPEEAKALLRTLEADFRPHRVTLAGLACWWYRGGPWEEIARYRFAA